MLAPRRFTSSLFSLALAAPLFASSRALYIPLDPLEMALAADVVVVGTVVEFDLFRVRDTRSEHAFSIRVEELVAGDVDTGELVVRQFADWACASRYAPYESGQRAIFHLAWPRDRFGNRLPGPLAVMSGGNEGEWPLDGDVAIHFALGWDEDLVPRERRLVRGREVWGVASRKDDVIAAIRELRALFGWERPRAGISLFLPCRHLIQRGSSADVEAFCASSPTAGHYADAIAECRRELARHEEPATAVGRSSR